MEVSYIRGRRTFGLAVQVEGNIDDDAVAAGLCPSMKQGRLEQQGRLIVQQVLPTLRWNELRQDDHRQGPLRSPCIQRLKKREQRTHRRSVRRHEWVVDRSSLSRDPVLARLELDLKLYANHVDLVVLTPVGC